MNENEVIDSNEMEIEGISYREYTNSITVLGNGEFINDDYQFGLITKSIAILLGMVIVPLTRCYLR